MDSVIYHLIRSSKQKLLHSMPPIYDLWISPLSESKQVAVVLLRRLCIGRGFTSAKAGSLVGISSVVLYFAGGVADLVVAFVLCPMPVL